MATVVLPVYTDMHARDAIPRSRAAATQALAIDSTIAEAHAALGLANTYDNDFAAGEREYVKAIALDSSFATARYWHAQLLHHNGRFDESFREAQRAIALEPASLTFRAGTTLHLVASRRLDAADSAFRVVNAFDSTAALVLLDKGNLEIARQRYGDAVATFERLAKVPNLTSGLKLGSLAYAYALAGRAADARAALARLPSDTLLACAEAAAALDALGDRDAAVIAFEHAVASQDQWLFLSIHSSHFDALRREPRLAAAWARISAK
jgi:tetratricopeptide (TPR) repeat protein